jgi:gluconate kinase
MGVKNYLIEGVSGTGKTAVCRELRRRGYHAINGDRELAYQGDPETGEPTDGLRHEHHIWHITKVKSLVASQDDAVTFFCGGSRNFPKFIDLFDGVFVLEVDLETLNRRLDERPPDEWGGKQPERDLIRRLHQTREDIPRDGIVIDATKPLAHVVDDIIRQTGRPPAPGIQPTGDH